MHAIRVRAAGGPEVLVWEEVPEPTPGPNELVVDVEAVGINFIEVYQRSGQYNMTLPYTPGAEAAGRVRETGSGVSAFRVGDRIVTLHAKGAYAKRTVVAAERAVRIPEGVTSRQAAAVFLQGITAHYLTTSTFALGSGHQCLVHAAAGGVGLLLCQMAKMRGAFVIGTASTAEKLALARGGGADATINYTTEDFAAASKRITDGAGVHVVYDSVGKTTFEGSLDALRPRGLLALFGQSSGPVPPLDPQVLNRKGSLFLTRPTIAHYLATREELEWRSNEVLTWVRDGKLAVRIGAEFPLDKASEAQRALESRRTTGKVLLTV